MTVRAPAAHTLTGRRRLCAFASLLSQWQSQACACVEAEEGCSSCFSAWLEPPPSLGCLCSTLDALGSRRRRPSEKVGRVDAEISPLRRLLQIALDDACTILVITVIKKRHAISCFKLMNRCGASISSKNIDEGRAMDGRNSLWPRHASCIVEGSLGAHKGLTMARWTRGHPLCDLVNWSLHKLQLAQTLSASLTAANQ